MSACWYWLMVPGSRSWSVVSAQAEARFGLRAALNSACGESGQEHLVSQSLHRSRIAAFGVLCLSAVGVEPLRPFAARKHWLAPWFSAA